MFISGGENVYPAEVEQVLAAYVDVDDAAVVATEHPGWGETGFAFVVAKRDTTLDAEKLMEHCRSSLAPYKVPSQIRVIEELPRTSVGKIDKIRLALLAQNHL